MEFASYLAGERFSDHPDCTDPSLAALARAVNDLVADDRRDELLGDIPRVIGLRDVPGADLLVAVSSAASALPIASMERQHVLAVGMRSALDALDGLGIAVPELRARAAAACAMAPGAMRWADAHRDVAVSFKTGQREAGSLSIVRVAVLGVAQACVDDVDDRLIRMLREAIDILEPARRPVATRTSARTPEPVRA